jgi:sulfite reductase (NADPH) flavoprotein alpha-component
VAVLGFGDRSFPKFGAFAEAVSAALCARGWPLLLNTRLIDRNRCDTSTYPFRAREGMMRSTAS